MSGIEDKASGICARGSGRNVHILSFRIYSFPCTHDNVSDQFEGLFRDRVGGTNTRDMAVHSTPLLSHCIGQLKVRSSPFNLSKEPSKFGHMVSLPSFSLSSPGRLDVDVSGGSNRSKTSSSNSFSTYIAHSSCCLRWDQMNE